MQKKTVLRGKKTFSTLYNKGKSFGSKYIVVFYRKNGLEYNRTGFLASKKVGNSVVRNRARRLMKESFRQLSKEIGTGYDIVFIARTTLNNKEVKCVEVFKNMKFIFKKIGINKNLEGELFEKNSNKSC